MSPPSYNPREFKALTYHDATASFGEGTNSPRAYLERCLETIAEKEPSIDGSFSAIVSRHLSKYARGEFVPSPNEAVASWYVSALNSRGL